MQYFSLLLWLILSSACLFSLEFGLDAKKEGDIPLNRVQIFAERCSGSNYLQALIKRNFFLQEEYCYGHKHFPIWLHIPVDQQLSLHNESLHDFYTLGHNEGCLFIVIFRNPYDWIRSLHKSPHHSAKCLRKMSFARFIRSYWRLDEKDPSVQEERAKNPLADKDPKTGLDFKNVMQLRNAKNKTFLMLKEKIHNIYYINYEVLCDNPQEVIQEISQFFGIKMKGAFIDVKEYKGDPIQGIFSKSKYKPIFINNLLYINAELDDKLEEQLGYTLKRGYVK